MITDAFFVAALRASDDVNTLTGGRIFGTVDSETEPDSESVPSVVVYYEGTQNDDETKDDEMEGTVDVDTITVGVSAESRSQLATLAKAVRNAVRDAVSGQDDDDADVVILDYRFSAGRVSFDWEKPCWWQELTWQCEVENDV